MNDARDLALAELAAVVTAVHAEHLTAEEALTALPLVASLRVRLDRCERFLIESARAGGASWTRVATSLGLASRQAAEQRLLRLSAQPTRDPGAARSFRQDQRSLDVAYGPALARLRAALRKVHAQVEVDPGWDRLFPRAALCRASLALAADAAPGALFALAQHVLADLDAAPAGVPIVAAVRRRLRAAVETAIP